MKKINLFHGKNMLTAGLLGILVVFGANMALAAEETAAVQEAAATAEEMTAAQETAGTAEETAAAQETVFGAENQTLTAAVDAAGAEEIAFADAGVTADVAERLRTEAEWEDGEAVYEVSFTVDGIEYEYLIRETDGAILEWELDGRDLGDAAAEESRTSNSEKTADSETDTSQGADTLIGLERAREIALSDTGLDDAEVRFSKIKFEKDSYRTVYELEFYQDRAEYEYKIDAYTGEILEMERD